MKLILTQAVDGLGIPGDVVTVKDGYGRNYLVPRGLAMPWTPGGEKQVVQIKRARDAREIRDLAHAKEAKAQLEGLSVVIPARAGETGKLFGSITNADFVTAVRKAGGPLLDKRAVEVSHVKAVGSHKARVRVSPEVTAAVTFTVTAD